ncbi:MAG: pseudaminic acid cytidylyltransferase [Actinomycetota bacterium]|nr:pseudaminic acid cytidylyltransferase [Actinomycetota bacterium]
MQTGAEVHRLAVIPARGGSKRIPRKNIRAMSGRPLMAWAIETALASGEFDEVTVSTDDDEIARIAESIGATVPFRRPAALADDHASTASVIAHATSEMRRQGLAPDLVCCLYPAAIFVTADDLAGARRLLETSTRPYAAAVVRYSHPIQRALALDEGGELTPVDPEGLAMRTQDLPSRWHDAGQFYWGRTDAWVAGQPILPNAVGYPLAEGSVVDIDTEEDWRVAERLHSVKLRS